MRASPPEPTRSPARTVGRLLLGGFLVVAGIGHLVATDEFRAQVPSWFPIDVTVTVVLSGLVEIALGVALLVAPERARAVVGIVVAAFFVAIFPGNVAQYVEGTDAFGLTTDTGRLVRLLFQPLLVLWATWSTGLFPRTRDDRAR